MKLKAISSWGKGIKMNTCKDRAALEQAENARYHEHQQMLALNDEHYASVTERRLELAQRALRLHSEECEVCNG